MNGSRRLLKTNAKKSIRQNYWRFIAVCFLVTIICGSSFTSTQLFQQNSIDEIGTGFSQLIAQLESGDTVSSVLSEGTYHFMRGKKVLESTLLLVSVLLWIFYKIFIANIVKINSKRFFMETRTYPKTSVKKLGYLYKGKNVKNPAKIMLCMYAYRFLWLFTIIGGIIKSYEYVAIPYILAENPDISKKEAFRLSKDVMHGKKFGLFTLQISFFLWFILGIVTMGLSNIFYVNAYYAATETEYYMMLRREIIAQRSKNSRYFPDNYLENRPTEDEILINMFVLEKDYMPNLESDEFSQNVYPMFLRGKESKWYEAPYTVFENRKYHVTTYVLLFFLTSIAGWLIDVSVGFLKQGEFFTGGLLFGPWMPIIGLASVAILLVGNRLMNHPIVNVMFITVFASAVEYFHVWLVDTVKHVQYWDFSGYLLNVNGRICLTSAVAVGAMGTALFYVIGPELDAFLEQFPPRKKWKMCAVLMVLFLIDLGLTGYFYFSQLI